MRRLFSCEISDLEGISTSTIDTFFHSKKEFIENSGGKWGDVVH